MAMKTHTVRPGETLESIAKAYYNDESLDVYIYKHNTQVIRDINQIYPGQIIVIPHLPLLRWVE